MNDLFETVVERIPSIIRASRKIKDPNLKGFISELLYHLNQINTTLSDNYSTSNGELNPVSSSVILELLNSYLKSIASLIENLKDSTKSSRKLRIFASKLQTINEYLEFGLKFDKEDLLCLNTENERWKKLGQVIEYVKLAEDLEAQTSRFLANVAKGQAFISRGLKEPTKLRKRLMVGLYMIWYGLQKTKAIEETEYFYSKPNAAAAKTVWNMLDSTLGGLHKVTLPSINFNKVIFLPRLAREVTSDELVSVNLKNSVHYVDQIHNEPIIGGSRFTLEWDEGKVRVPVRVLSPGPITQISPKSSKTCFCVPDSEVHFDKLVLHIHGGGFISMSSSSHQSYTRKWANALGLPVFSIDYRLAPEHKFPSALDDCWQAYYWLVNYSSKFLGIKDPKIILAGDSAGGNLAAALTIKLISAGYRVPDGLFLAYPAVNLIKERFSFSLVQSLDDMLVPHTFLKLCLESYLEDSSAAEHNPLISPLVAPDDVLEMFPPVRMMVGTKDPLHDDVLRFCERLLDCGVDVELKVYEGLIHGGLNFCIKGGIPACQNFLQDSIELLRQLSEI